ncbi:MAG: hypothetical protein QOJ02_1194 [Acidobacteriota bacterium]|jgi:hypothetical protein|nr:hypothetical protein [Acidobacteriota bacterium]
MRSLRKLIGIVLLAAVASLGGPAVMADGPQESPGITSLQKSLSIIGPQESPGVVGPQESPGITTEIIIYLASALIP